MNMQSKGGSDLRAMLLEVYKKAFGRLPQTLADTEEVLREVVHQLSHHPWPAAVKASDVYDCLVVAREELELDEFLFGQAKAWVQECLDSPPAQAVPHESQGAYL